MEQSQKQHQVCYLLPEKSTAVTHSGQKWKCWYDGTCRVLLLTPRISGTKGLLYLSDGLGQHHANPPLRTFLSFLTWAENQRSPHFSSDDQLAIENLLPASFPLPNSLFLPPVLQSRSPICICTFQPRNEDQKGCCDGQN